MLELHQRYKLDDTGFLKTMTRLLLGKSKIMTKTSLQSPSLEYVTKLSCLKALCCELCKKLRILCFFKFMQTAQTR